MKYLFKIFQDSNENIKKKILDNFWKIKDI